MLWSLPTMSISLGVLIFGAALVADMLGVLAKRRAQTARAEGAGPPVSEDVVPALPEPGELPVIRLYDDEGDDEPMVFGPGGAGESCPAVPIAFDPAALEEEDTALRPQFELAAACRSDVGRTRRVNEDRVLFSAERGLCVVADGMGGHQGGAVASELAVETIAKVFEERTFEGRPHKTLPPRAGEVVRAIQKASSRIREMARDQPELSEMGTTVVAARFSPDKGRLYVGHVGDSRCYRFRDGVLERMTDDHTMASLGVVGERSAHLFRAVGAEERVLTDLVVATPRVGDLYLLCSDGLTKMVPDRVIRELLAWAARDVESAADWLIEVANQRGGSDNVSVVVVSVTETQQIAA
jgi:protein phosphatase